MNNITRETDNIVLKSMKGALIKRYTSSSGQLPIIEDSECTNSKGDEGYALSIKAYGGIPETLKPVPSQELIRVLRAGFKAMGFDAMQMGLERRDNSESKAVFVVSKGLLQAISLKIGFDGDSHTLINFSDAVTQAKKTSR